MDSKPFQGLHLNNMGASALLHGRLHQAMKLFTRALKTTKMELSKKQKSRAGLRTQALFGAAQSLESRQVPTALLCRDLSNTRGNSQKQKAARSRRSNLQATKRVSEKNSDISTDSECPSGASKSQEKLISCSHREMYVCVKPCLVLDKDEDSEDDNVFLMRLVVAIIFNTALCYHQQALKDYVGREANSRLRKVVLMKALALYNLSCRLQLNEDVALEDAHLLSHINNMGAIHAETGNYTASNRCFDRLLSHLFLFGELNRNRERSGLFQKTMEGFYGNISHLILKDASVAAAA